MSSDVPMSLHPIQQHHFRRVCAKFATGITVVTVLNAAGEPEGMTVNSFTSVSLEPPLVLFCADFRTRLLEHLDSGKRIGINVLREDQKEISTRFATPGADRFDGVEWFRGETGVPVLKDMLATLECEICRVVEAGDHAVMVCQVHHATWSDGPPLIYFNSSYRALNSPSE